MIYCIILVCAYLGIAIGDVILFHQLLVRVRKLEKRVYDLEFYCPRLKDINYADK